MPHITSPLPELSDVEWTTFIQTQEYVAWRESQEEAAGLKIADMAKQCCVGATRVAPGCIFSTSRGVLDLSDDKFNEFLLAELSPPLMEEGFDPSDPDSEDVGDGDVVFSSDAEKLRALLTGGFPGSKRRQAVMGALPSIARMLELAPGACVPEGVETPALGAVPTVASLLGHLGTAGWSKLYVNPTLFSRPSSAAHRLRARSPTQPPRALPYTATAPPRPSPQ
jgi:hypothetical protein